MKKFALLTLLILFCAAVGQGWYLIRDGFQVSRVLGWDDQVESPWSEEAEGALAQRYYTLGRGRQCYAFVSEDGKYVIKIPRYDRYRVPLWLRSLPFNAYRERRRSEGADLKKRLLESFRISAEDLKEETGTVGIHFRRALGKSITIVDQLGRSFDLPLHKIGFVLQYKKELFRDVFQAALSKQGKEGISKVLDDLIVLIADRGRKGVLCKDGSFLRNFGFDEKGAYQIDVGSFYRMPALSEDQAYELSVRNSLAPIREWIGQIDPSYLAMLDQKIMVLFNE